MTLMFSAATTRARSTAPGGRDRTATLALAGMTALGLLAAAPAAAMSPLVYASIPDLTVAGFSEYCSPCSGQGRAYDRFSLSAATALDGAEFTASTFLNFPGDVALGIFADTGAAGSSGIGVEIARFAFTPARFTSLADTFYGTTVVGVGFARLELAAGDYLFSVLGAGDFAAPSYLKPGGAVLTTPGGTYRGEATGFKLFGAPVEAGPVDLPVAGVPEPRTWGMIVAGFGVVGLSLRHRRGMRSLAC